MPNKVGFAVNSEWIKKNRDAGLLCLIVTLTFLLYLGTLPKEFTNWDDDEYVVHNPLIRSFSLTNLNKIVTEPYFANYAPVTLLSYAVDYHLWKLNPTGYHFHNVALHLGCVVALFFLLRKWGLPHEVVLITTCIFAIHPMNVESVSWTSERKNLLASLFFLLSFGQYIEYTKNRAPRNYLLSLLCFLLSILAKASTVVAPLVFLAYDHCREKVRIRDLRLYDKLAFVVAAEILTFLSIQAAGTRTNFSFYHKGGPGLSLLGSGSLFQEYLTLLFWPTTNLTPVIYPHTIPSFGSLATWLSFVASVLVVVLLYKKSRHLFFWGLFFLILLVPVLNLFPLPIVMANRYLYLAQVGVWVIFSVLTRKLIGFLSSLRMVRTTVVTGLVCWMLFLSCQSWRTARVWRNSYTLWSDAVEKNFEDHIAHQNLGSWYQVHGFSRRAGLEFLMATQIKPKYSLSLSSLAGYYLQEGRLDRASQELYAATNQGLDSEVLLINLGKVLALRGKTARAIHMFYRASYLNPRSEEPLDLAVLLYLASSQPQAALDVAQTIIERFPESPVGFFRLGTCFEAKGDYGKALHAWQESKSRLPQGDPMMDKIDSKISLARRRLGLGDEGDALQPRG